MNFAGLGRHKRNLAVVAGVFAWLALGVAGLLTTAASEPSQDCPNGPLFAELTGPAISGRAPRGTAQFRERGSNALMVMVRQVNLAEGTILGVFVGGNSVGQITLPKNGSGQLRLDTTTATINEGTAIEIRNGTTVVLSGTFKCVPRGGRGNTNTNISPSPTMTASPTATVSPSPTMTMSPSPTVSPTATMSPSPTMMP